jgi:hypothetical protein
MRITEQYFWNFVFSVFFVVLVFLGSIILESGTYRTWASLTLLDLSIITLATFRLIRLVTYDKITAFFREQFYDEKSVRGGVVLEKPAGGPRRTLADLVSCPWCLGVWGSAMVIFFYMLTPYAYYPILLLAIAGVATVLQLTANLIGWYAEGKKLEVEDR